MRNKARKVKRNIMECCRTLKKYDIKIIVGDSNSKMERKEIQKPVIGVLI